MLLINYDDEMTVKESKNFELKMQLKLFLDT